MDCFYHFCPKRFIFLRECNSTFFSLLIRSSWIQASGIIPLYHQDILAKYDAVLHREKFHLHEKVIRTVLGAVRQYGVEVFPQPTGAVLIDMDDLVFYEVAMEKRDDDAYLVTGNQKHYPFRDFIITPAEMIAIIETTKEN